MSPNPEYRPVPVEAAKRIADEFRKVAVVILAFDAEHDLVHTTTYGATPLAKDQAAKIGDALPQMLGADVMQSKWYEDYRATEAAQYKAQIDALVAELDSMIERFKRAVVQSGTDREFAEAAVAGARAVAARAKAVA
jgi:hypothetical protein